MSIIKLIFHLFFLSFFELSITLANDLMYLKHTCSNKKTFAPNSTYQSILHTLLTSLSSHAAATQFYNITVGGGEDASETIYGLFMCRGDVTNQTCQECMAKATQQIASNCAYSKEAILWYHECFVRYSNRCFFSTVDEWPRLEFVSYNVTTNLTKEGSYGWLLAKTLTDAVTEAANAGPVGTKKFATRKATLQGSEEDVYALVECTPDLSSEDCRRCLGDIMSNIPLCCLGRDGGMVLYPSCSLMFGLHLFYRDAARAVAPTWTTPTPPLSYTLQEIAPLIPREQKSRSPLIMTAMVPIVVLFMVFFANRIRRIKALRRYKAILKENFGNESSTLESLQFDLATIEAATNKFSYENMIGKGGFGEVYKGILPDGREVAVKRLSKSSGQGAIEFKNEVLLIAKLQHRNLVALLGFCLQEEEKILVYEFVPNKSLDYFLFDPQKQRLLSWCERYKIIGGIAPAILYLHEYSRLKIIHRDIKPSNVLLDDKMNPKVSDFGMARMVAIDQEQGRTNRIVGTYGYMSPEYAMLGKFSEKSDIFSFGVMVLEIISGKRNSSSYNKPYYVDGLSSYAWKQWRDGTPFEILDPSLRESCCRIEVIKCIHIGLLCVQENPDDRPLMAEVVSYLSNPSIELPFPREPAFFIHGGKEPNMVAIELDLGPITSNSTPYSINEMSIRESIPR